MHPVEAELFHADGETDMTKLIVVLRNLRTRLEHVIKYIGNFPYIYVIHFEFSENVIRINIKVLLISYTIF